MAKLRMTYAILRKLYAVLAPVKETSRHEHRQRSTASPATATSAPPARPLPPSIELAWGLRDRRGARAQARADARADRRRRDRDRRREGLEALSMSRVARELGVGTMSLYRYVAAKDELLTLMVDAALGRRRRRPRPARTGGAGRRGGRWAYATRTSATRGRCKIPINAPPLGPQQRRLAGKRAAGARRHAAVGAAEALVGAAGQRVRPQRGDADRGLRRRVRGRAGDARLRQAAGAADRQADFPALHRAIVSGALDDGDDIDHEFDFGLERVLDGSRS